MVRSDLCDFSDTSFIGCILIINNTLIDNAEDLDVVMPMYNLIEYIKNYRETTGSLWNYYRNELSDVQVIMIIQIKM